MDFGREGGCGGSYLAAPPTSARVQNRVEFVELARDMSSNCTRSHWDRTGCYDRRLVVPEVSLYKFENIGYLHGTKAPPVCYVLVSLMNMYI